MRKTYVLDTSALISDPYAFDKYDDRDVVISITVLNELDNLKKQASQAGRNARVAIKALDELSDLGDISIGVLTDNNVLVKVDTSIIDFSNPAYASFGDPTYGDTQILACAYSHFQSHPDQDVTLVSNDINLRVKAKSRGIPAESGDDSKSDVTDLYSGIQVINDEQAGLDLQQNGVISPEEADCDFDLFPNECVLFESDHGDGISAGRKVAPDKIKLIKKSYPWGLATRNKEQAFALDLIMDRNVDLVTLTGKAGCGKTILALAAALELVLSKKEYDKMVIYRPIESVGNEIGHLPGFLEEKLAPWFQAIVDNFEVLFSNKNGSDSWKRELEMYQKKGKIEFAAMSYIRGRSVPNSIMIVDECFPYDQFIEIEGGKKRIGTLYNMWSKNEKLPLVKTYNEEKDCFEYNKITHAWNRGERDLVKITCGNREIKCTKNHKFLTEHGWKEASKLSVGDLVKTTESNKFQILKSLNSDQEQILLGSFLGDGRISNHGLNRYRLRVIHGKKQEAYCEWKASMFNSNLVQIEKNGIAKKPAVNFCSKMIGISNKFPKSKTTCPQWILDKLDARGLAIWFMDDGSFVANNARISTCSFDEDSQIRFVKKLKSMGIDCRYTFYKSQSKLKKHEGYFYLIFNKKGYEKLNELILPYIHENIAYKAKGFEYCKKYNWNNKFNNTGFTVVDKIEYLDKKEIVYDLEIENNHNFIISSSAHGSNGTGGPIAHNCQNISPNEMKTILTRAGENTKVILIGDIEQIDRPSLDATNNGLTYVIDKFKDSELAGHVTFTQGERSRLATLASKIL